MRLTQTIYFLLALVTTIHALALPASFESIGESAKELFKRKGGGGGGGKGGGSSSSSSSSSSSGSSGSGSSSGSSGSSGSSSSGSRGSGSSSSSSSGASSVRPSFGGGRYYGGGATTPYRSNGQRSPGGVAPYFLGGAALAFFPGIWLYGAYAYPYGHPYTYHNDTSGRNETRPVECLCGRYQQCGCDNNTDTSYLNSVANNNTVSRVANVNGTDTLVVNGTLPNDTDASTTSGAAGVHGQGLAEMSGLWVVVAGVTYTMWFM